MKQKSIILSASGLKNLVINDENKSENEFLFIIGDKKIQMHNFFAEFISPAVSHIHHCDPTITSMILSNKKVLNNLLTENTIDQINKLSHGDSISIDKEEEISSLRYLSVIFGNEELFNKINEISPSNKKKKNVSQLIEEIEIYSQINPNFSSFNYSSLIDEISKELSSSNNERLPKIPKQIFYSIITNKNFKSDDEDALFDMINDLFSEEDLDNDESELDIIQFYESIDIKKLSSKKFAEFITKLDYTKMRSDLWHKLCEIFIEKFQVISQKDKKFEFDGNNNNRFKGIINYLRGEQKINVCDAEIVNVTASSFNSNRLPKNAVDFDSKNYFLSDNNYPWLKYDFKDKKIRPTSYSIMTRDDSDNQNPVNWCIEVSNTDKDNDWKIIDTRKNVSSVSKRNQSDTFDISTKLPDNESYRYVRFRSNGKSSGNGNYLYIAISSIEYFGTLVE